MTAMSLRPAWPAKNLPTKTRRLLHWRENSLDYNEKFGEVRNWGGEIAQQLKAWTALTENLSVSWFASHLSIFPKSSLNSGLHQHWVAELISQQQGVPALLSSLFRSPTSQWGSSDPVSSCQGF